MQRVRQRRDWAEGREVVPVDDDIGAEQAALCCRVLVARTSNLEAACFGASGGGERGKSNAIACDCMRLQ